MNKTEKSVVYSEKKEFYSIHDNRLLIFVHVIVLFPVGFILSAIFNILVKIHLDEMLMMAGFLSIILTWLALSKDSYLELTAESLLRKRRYDDKILEELMLSDLERVELDFFNYRGKGNLTFRLYFRNNKQKSFPLKVYFGKSVFENIYNVLTMYINNISIVKSSTVKKSFFNEVMSFYNELERR